MERINIFTKQDKKLEFNPLEDRAFQIILKDYEIFKFVIESITGRSIQEKVIYQINQTLNFTVNGKEIRLDGAFDTDEILYNIEGQNKTSEFKFKRHLYYWSIIFASLLQKSDPYSKLKPVVSIVVYKDKGNKNDIIQEGSLTGNIFDTVEDKTLLSLISVNTSQWRKAENEGLKIFTSLIYNDGYTEATKDLFEGVDVHSKMFKTLNNSIIKTCGGIKQKEAEKRGDIKMAELYKNAVWDTAWDTAWKTAWNTAEKEGAIKGKIEAFLEMGLSIEDISKKINVPLIQVKTIISALQSEGKI